MTTAHLMPPTHAETIRACGVGFRAHRFLHAHMGARPVVVIEAQETVACSCCGGSVGAGERVLRFDYGVDPAHGDQAYLHPLHCVRGSTPVEARQIASVTPRLSQPLAA